MGGFQSNKTGVLIRGEGLGHRPVDTQRKDYVKTEREDGYLQGKRGLRMKPVNSLILDFQPPQNCKEIHFCSFKPPTLWCFVMKLKGPNPAPPNKIPFCFFCLCHHLSHLPACGSPLVLVSHLGQK